MKLIAKLLGWLRFILPIALITIGIILNGNVVVKLISQKLSSSSPTSSQTLTPTSIPSAAKSPITATEVTPSVQPKPKNYSLPPTSTQAPDISPTPLRTKPPFASLETKPPDKPKFGHFPYQESDRQQLVIFASYATQQHQRFESLHPETAKALMKMIYAARDDGVWILPVSGFRTVEQQQELFNAQIQRRGSAKAAAKVSAPPGYSEHHTGFAVDLTDGNFPDRDITIDFESTKAYQWLTRHAKEFGFELSFPPNNLQGVNYEPWHWRYVGSQEAAAIFSKAKKLLAP